MSAKKLDVTVLYVEDDTFLRQTISRILKRRVSTLLVAENGREGLGVFKEERPDIVVTDIKMPSMNGLEMSKEILAIDRSVPIIITIAHNEVNLLVGAIEIGISKYVLKPIDIENLYNSLYKIAETINLKKKLEQESKLLEEYKRAVDLSTIVLKSDDNGKVVYINDKFRQLTGFTDQEVVGQDYWQFLDPQEMEDFKTEKMNAIKAGKKWQGIIKYQGKGKNIYHLDTILYPILDPSGTMVEVLSLGNNITGLIEKEDELKAALKKVKQADELKGQFLANMSHEIRTPMNGILGFSRLLGDTHLDTSQHEYVQAINKSTVTLLCIINDILDFSKIESGKIELEKISFNPLKEFETTVSLFSVKANDKNITLMSFIDPNLPETILGDPTRIKQVLINLTENGLKFTPENGSLVVRIEPIQEIDNQCKILFSVSDTGIGISEEKQKIIFDPFAQADGSMSRKYGGTGLGLSISSNLVSLMGGKLFLESQENVGSIFSFTIYFEIEQKSTAINYQKLQDLKVGFYSPEDLHGDFEKIMDDYCKSFGYQIFHYRDNQEWQNYDLDIVFVNCANALPDQLTAILPRLAELGSPVVGIAKQNQQKQLGPIRKMLKKIIYMPVNGSKLFDAIVDIIGIETDLESQEPVAKVKSAPGQGGKLKIDNVRALVAEDNAVNQQLITIMLKEIGIESEIAENGLVAMEKYCNGKYDIVLMDINMPECNGIEATRKIVQYEKENNINHIPIVALTAYAMKGDREKMISLGVDDYLSKPINKGELDTVLTRYLVK